MEYFNPCFILLVWKHKRKRKKKSKYEFFPPDPLLIGKPGLSVSYPNRHFLIIGLWVMCQSQGQLNMFTALNGKNKSFAWILYINQLANHIYGTKIKVKINLAFWGEIGFLIVWISVGLAPLALAVSPETLKTVPVLVPTFSVSMVLDPALQRGVSVVWRVSLYVCYTCEYARQMLAGSQADRLSSPWPFWLGLWHGDTQ